MNLETPEVFLVNPNTEYGYREEGMKNEYIGLGYLSSYLRSVGRTSEVIDARLRNLTVENVLEKVGRSTGAIVGITLFSESATPWVSELVNRIKSADPGAHVVLWGYYPTLQTKKVFDLIPWADSVVKGEWEQALAELVDKILQGGEWKDTAWIAYRDQQSWEVLVSLRRMPEGDLDSLPFADRHADESQISEILMEGSRGCFSCCSFCAIRPFIAPSKNGLWRGRSADHLVDEMVHLRSVYPSIKRFRFIDPCFFWSSGMADRNMKIAKSVSERLPGIEMVLEWRVLDLQEESRSLLRELKKAGLKEIYLWLESGSQSVLDMMRKEFRVEQALESLRILEEEGVFYEFGFMMFSPWTQESDIDANVRFLRRVHFLPMHLMFRQMDVIPSTPSAKQVKGLVPKGTTGYFTYENVPTVQKLKAFARFFEASRKDFFEESHKLYEGVRAEYESGNVAVIGVSRILSDMAIEAFEFCRNALQSSDDFSEVANRCTDIFLPKMLAVRNDIPVLAREG